MATSFSFMPKPMRFTPHILCQIVCFVWLFGSGFPQQICKSNIQCQCNSTYIRCNGLPKLTSIPTDVYADYTELDFNNNSISAINENDFTSWELLQFICLSNNNISSIHPRAFKNLYLLQILNLEGNQLTALDPFGRMFQHLVSLRWLNLKNNQIVHVSRYAFFTLGASGNVSVTLNQNPLQCDCEIWALRNWALTRSSVQISMECANESSHSCNSSQEVFNSIAECFVCAGVTTNYKCTLMPTMTCITPAQVCQKTVQWNASDKMMRITAKCDSYQTCLADEAKNNETCVMKPNTGGSKSCSFCCRGPTCVTNTVGGRTKDFIFYLSFKGVASLLVPYLKDTIPKNMQTTVTGGLDLDVYEFTPERSQYKVVLLLRLTTFNTETKESVQSILNEDLKNNDNNGYLHSLGADSYILSSHLEGMECNNMADLCPANLTCTNSPDNRTRCLCDNYSFFKFQTGACLLVTELQVKDITVVGTTSDSISLSWTADKHETSVQYTMQVLPRTSQEIVDYITTSGARLSNLTPGTHYIITVIATLNRDFYTKTVNTTIFGVWTLQMQTNATATPAATKNVTIFISYVRQNAEYQDFMNNSKSEKYLQEEARIITGVKSAISKTVDSLSIHVVEFRPTTNQQYKVLLQIEVTASHPDLIKRAIIEAIQNDTNNPGGFFYQEQLEALDLSSNVTDYQCPYSVTSLDKGVIRWNATAVGLQYAHCPFNNPLKNSSQLFATRKCLRTINEVVWGEVNDSLCVTKAEQENPDIDVIFDTNVTAGNAGILSSFLKSYTEKLDNFTVEMMNRTVKLLEQLTTQETLAQPAVSINVVGCVSNLFKVNDETLKQSERETNASKRLLSVIDSVSNETPLTGDSLRLVTANLAVAAHKVNSGQTEDIVLVADSGSGHNGSKQVNVDFSNKNSSSLENGTSIVIPVVALFDSLTPGEKNHVKRITFTVHRSDVLFASIENTQVRGRSLVNATENSATENGSSGQSKGKSLLFTTKINSQVISASIPGVRVHSLSNNITMSFEHLNANATNAKCVFWDESVPQGSGGWSDEGCGIVTSLSGRTTCGCNHLTNFALLMDVYGEGSNLSDFDRQALSIISYVGCGISFLALLLTLIIYSVFRTLRRDNPSKILINLCLSLLCSNFIFLVGMQEYSFGNTASCKAVAVLLHYFLLASMCWMAVEAFYMYLALVRVFKTYFTNFILKCCLFGWGVPLVIVIITLAVNASDNYGFINSGLCWLRNPAFYAAFVGPVCLILLIDCLAFLMVVKQLVGMSSNGLHKSDKSSTIQHLRGAVGVVILLGLSWIFAVFAIDRASVAFYYLFAVSNSLQGLFIFIFYCLLKKDVIKALKRCLPCFETFADSSKSNVNSRGIMSRSANSKLAGHKSTSSSKSNGNTNSTNSNSGETRKDSCFSTLSASSTLDSPHNEKRQGFADTDISTFMSTTGAPQPSLSPRSIKTELQAYVIPQPEHSVRNFDNNMHNSYTVDPLYSRKPRDNHSPDSSIKYIDQNSNSEDNSVTGSYTIDKYQNSTSESVPANSSHTQQNSTSESVPANSSHTQQNSTLEKKPSINSEHHSDISSDPSYSPNNGSSFPAQTSSNIQQTAASEHSAHLGAPQTCSPATHQQLSSFANSNEAMTVLNPCFAPFSAQGEIDYSHTASVGEIMKKFDWSMGKDSQRSDSHVTKT